MGKVALGILLHTEQSDDRDHDVGQPWKAGEEAVERSGVEHIEAVQTDLHIVTRAQIGGVRLQRGDVAPCEGDIVTRLGKSAGGGAADIGGATKHQNGLA